jgi:hypothetical protein
MLNEAQALMLLEPNPAIITTLRSDGRAHSTLGWVDWDGEFVLLNTVVGRLKERHLRRDDRISVCIVDRNNTSTGCRSTTWVVTSSSSRVWSASS